MPAHPAIAWNSTNLSARILFLSRRPAAQTVLSSAGPTTIVRFRESDVNQSTPPDRIIDPIREQMLAIVWRLLRTPHDVEDALHATLTRLWER